MSARPQLDQQDGAADSFAPSAESSAFLSRARPGRYEWRFFLIVTAISMIVFGSCVPYVRERLRPLPAFVGVYNSVLMNAIEAMKDTDGRRELTIRTMRAEGGRS